MKLLQGLYYEVSGNETFTAWKGGGAWLNGSKIHVSKAATWLTV